MFIVGIELGGDLKLLQGAMEVLAADGGQPLAIVLAGFFGVGRRALGDGGRLSRLRRRFIVRGRLGGFGRSLGDFFLLIRLNLTFGLLDGFFSALPLIALSD